MCPPGSMVTTRADGHASGHDHHHGFGPHCLLEAKAHAPSLSLAWLQLQALYKLLQVDDKAAAQKDKPASVAAEAAAQPSSAAAAATPGQPSIAAAATPRPASTLSRQSSGRAGGTPKAKDTPRTVGKTAMKSSKKLVPASFVEVVDCLVDVCLQYKGMQPGEEADLADPVTTVDPVSSFEVYPNLILAATD